LREWYFISKKPVLLVLGSFFIIFSFYSVYYLRNQGEYNFFLFIVLSCIATDIGGYLFGKTFKGPKLTKISPNKTYAGMFGGFIMTIIIGFLFYNNLKFLDLDISNISTSEIIIYSLIISLFSQIGDLSVSFFKRKAKINNTGNLIPGHGGLLDRIDGMLLAFPSIYIVLKIIQ
jgi:phosphatidate cytidylyltransferase